jgi:hypothetical protein
MRSSRSISTVLLFLGLAGSVFAYSAQDQHNENQGNGEKQDKHEKEAKPEKQNKQQDQRNTHQAHPEHQQQQAKQKEQHQQPVQAHQQARAPQQEQHHQYPVVAKQEQQDRPAGWDKGKKVGWGNGDVPPGQQKRLPQERQHQLIVQQQQRDVDYRRHLDQQQDAARRYSEQLQQERHMASYRYQQEYEARLRQQQIDLQRSYDYDNDPYYYSVPTYRYYRGGSNYETNEYGANALRQAVNAGYEQGFRNGRAAREDNWSSRYQDSYAYQDANYGYNGRYVDQDDYNYYFRQGFSRGYEDGYYSRSQYGSYSNGGYSILGGILSGILNLQAIR